METTLRQILHIEYGIPGADIKKLYGYANVNYEVSTKEGRYVLKQYHEKEDLIAILLAENKVLNLLSNQLSGGCCRINWEGLQKMYKQFDIPASSIPGRRITCRCGAYS